MITVYQLLSALFDTMRVNHCLVVVMEDTQSNMVVAAMELMMDGRFNRRLEYKLQVLDTTFDPQYESDELKVM